MDKKPNPSFNAFLVYQFHMEESMVVPVYVFRLSYVGKALF